MNVIRDPRNRTAPVFRILVLGLLTAFFIQPMLAAADAVGPRPREVTIDTLPGAQPFSAELRGRLAEALAAKENYVPRTRHLRPDGTPEYTNRLILEASPYLLQHAHNPVNWYPWGEEAFETARRLNRLVLLSVGYSTCHWCHVMEEESFEDEEIARFINQHYVAIKVDREERPDIDSIYMKAVQLLTGRGGWPMTAWLTAEGVPFFGGTYFPPRDGDRGMKYGFFTYLAVIQQQYADEPEQIVAYSRQLGDAIRGIASRSGSGELPDKSVLDAAAGFYQERFDPFYGGLEGSPKFPSLLPVRFLLRYHRRSGDEEFLNMAVLTLEKMAAGGINDQLGGGFHRYSVDGEWLVPHFEKMLYDNAQLALAYLEGYQATDRQDFAQVARSILDYVTREMTAPEGAFYSATDADSLNPEGHREEGWFFTWTADEISELLGAKQARIFNAYYGVTEQGNFEGRSILHRTRSVDEVAEELGLEPSGVRQALKAARQRLYGVRAERPAPLRDDKIITSWNGLMISAFAVGGLILNDADYLRRAEKAADFILTRLRNNGRLMRSYKDGRVHHNGYLNDYAFLIAGLLDLSEASSNPRWLQEAVALQRVLDEHYRDDANGGYFLTSDDHETLLVREKPSHDGAEPSGNSVALMNLLRLYEFTTEDGYRAEAERLLKGFGERLASSPSDYSVMLLAQDFRLDTVKEIVIVTPNSRADAEPFLAALRQTFLPNKVLIVASEGEDLDNKARLVPLLKGKVAAQGKATAYVCELGVCQLPTGDVSIFIDQIKKSYSEG